MNTESIRATIGLDSLSTSSRALRQVGLTTVSHDFLAMEKTRRMLPTQANSRQNPGDFSMMQRAKNVVASQLTDSTANLE